MSTFDYPFLIEQLSDEGFNYCKSLLFPLLGYKYLTIEQVRKVDLCERINELTNHYPMRPGQKKNMSFEAYCEGIEINIQNNIKYKNGTTAEAYRNRAVDIIKELKENKEEDLRIACEKCLTLFAIYLGLIREVYPNLAKAVATDAHLQVDANDAELLKKLTEYKQKNTGFLGIETPAIFKKPGVQLFRETEVVYMHNVLLYCVLLEIQGEFSGGIKDGALA